MDMRKYNLLFLLVLFGLTLYSKEYHVSVKGNDANTGTENAPFRTIGKAALVAYPGDVITVHAGTYRERINPPRGGESDEKRIVYRAAPGELVEIKGSERITDWEKVGNGTWKVVLPDSFFDDNNPYKEEVSGDWMIEDGRINHTGDVFLNGISLHEADSLQKVLNGMPLPTRTDPEGTAAFWYCESDPENTTIWAHFGKMDPNKELTEISMRPTCFYPEKQGVNYLTISGFRFSQAATQWASPTGEQVGMIATHWNKGWIIEDNVISDSKCVGITLGKERSTGHNLYLQNKNKESSLHYTGTQYYTEVIFNVLRYGWNKENIGSHIVRNNVIFNCEEAGICGSMGAAFSEISGNHIYNIWRKRQFNGFEIAGIKFHGAIDTEIKNNRIHDCVMAIWLDWMSQGTRVSSNLMYHNDMDLFSEVNHGPYLVDNNILLSPRSIDNMSEGGAYVHNLIAGKIQTRAEVTRYTPYHLPHSTEIAGLSLIYGGDDRFYNNLFIPAIVEGDDKKREEYGLSVYNKTKYPSYADGNIYYNHALPFEGEKQQLVVPGFDPQMKITIEKDGVFLSFRLKNRDKPETTMVTTERLGNLQLPKQLFEQPDGNPISIDTDYLGNKRLLNPRPGPFELVKDGVNKFKVW